MATSDDRTPETRALPKDPPSTGPLGAPGEHEPAPDLTGGKPTGKTRRRKGVEKSRVGNAWIALIVAALLGIVLLIFILQNSESADVEMLFWNFSLPLGVTILLSVIAGALVMALVGGVRIVQLRRAAHRG
ncbi:LapA family protein [Nocardia sp. NBC_01329]|uniref:LapA family protein n=1 Tax=Nocardia sp. NBC_01329 TaxID=2903594 RepID=UPI002E1371B5|nr:lipopolysaccharide assembly protein LapA domain-containing protein [Nocardia sp. NBC_01329]